MLQVFENMLKKYNVLRNFRNCEKFLKGKFRRNSESILKSVNEIFVKFWNEFYDNLL